MLPPAGLAAGVDVNSSHTHSRRLDEGGRFGQRSVGASRREARLPARFQDHAPLAPSFNLLQQLHHGVGAPEWMAHHVTLEPVGQCDGCNTAHIDDVACVQKQVVDGIARTDDALAEHEWKAPAPRQRIGHRVPLGQLDAAGEPAEQCPAARAARDDHATHACHSTGGQNHVPRAQRVDAHARRSVGASAEHLRLGREAATATHELDGEHARRGWGSVSCYGDGHTERHRADLRHEKRGLGCLERGETHLGVVGYLLKESIAPLRIAPEVLQGLIAEVGAAFCKQHEPECAVVVRAPPRIVGKLNAEERLRLERRAQRHDVGLVLSDGALGTTDHGGDRRRGGWGHASRRVLHHLLECVGNLEPQPLCGDAPEL
mmetsp:Transcript_22903/g.70129  ORF Transcript_22903/g.70129 Transcript_22903/m.70129 type:complete len:374 (+) Transcript_22903:501-1622(+)|eukprot:scaffold131761_cov29-Tisochrysis_lutea.AAC.2